VTAALKARAATFDEVRDLYQEIILEHGRRPRNHRQLKNADGHADGDNPMCGDRIEVWVVRGADGRLADVTFQGRGCAICIASASLMTELVRDHDAAEARALSVAARDLAKGDAPRADGWMGEALDRLAPLSGVAEYPSRVKCATLAWHTLDAALGPGGKVSTE